MWKVDAEHQLLYHMAEVPLLPSDTRDLSHSFQSSLRLSSSLLSAPVEQLGTFKPHINTLVRVNADDCLPHGRLPADNTDTGFSCSSTFLAL